MNELLCEEYPPSLTGQQIDFVENHNEHKMVDELNEPLLFVSVRWKMKSITGWRNERRNGSRKGDDAAAVEAAAKIKEKRRGGSRRVSSWLQLERWERDGYRSDKRRRLRWLT